MKKVLIAVAVVMMAMLGVKAQTVDPKFQDGFLYVKLADDYPLNFRVDAQNNRVIDVNEIPFLKEVFARYGVVRVAQDLYLFNDPKLLRTLCVSFTQKENVESFINDLQQFKQIEYAEKRPIKHILMVPNDPYYGMVNSYNCKWHLDKVKAEYAWDEQTGSSSVKVAIVDNAVYGSHEDLGISSSYLASITWEGYSPSTSTGSANPPSTVSVSSESGYEWSHGTHCSGLACAKLNNGVGVASLGGGCTLMGVRTANNDGSMYCTDYGIQWAANSGAKVISMSFGSTQSSTTESNLLQTCYNAGIILVAAAGNEGDEDNSINYPGGYSTVISVAAINNNGKLASFSQYGTGRADIAAPGGFYGTEWYSMNLLSTTYCNNYYVTMSSLSGKRYDGMQGTSMACPMVAGLCGLLASAYSDITPAQAKSCLQSTAQTLASGSNQIDGNGYINAYAAVLCAKGLNGNSCGTPTNLTATAGASSIALNWTAVSGANYYKVLRNGSQIATATTNSYTDNSAAVNTSYTYTVKAVCSDGESTASNSASATIVSGGGDGDDDYCAYQHYPLTGTVTYYGINNYNGFVAGTNEYGDQCKAEAFTTSGAATVTKLRIGLAAVTSSSITGSVKFTIWADNGGTPGSVLGSKTVAFSDILNNLIDTVNYEYDCVFDSPISVNGTFYAGVDNSSMSTTDFYSLQTTMDGTALGTSWECYDGSWGTVSDNWGGLNFTMAIYPYVCTNGSGGGEETSCGTPTNLTATAGASNISLHWTAVSGANYYKVLRNGSQIATATTNSYTDNSAAVNTTYTYTVKAVCSSGESSASNSASARITGTTGINDNVNGTFILYPNPAQEYVALVFPDGQQEREVALYDVAGKLLQHESVSGSEIRINVVNLAQGVYFVKVGNVTKKFVKE